MRIKFKIHDYISVTSKQESKILIHRHLNFEVRYNVNNNIITHKSVWFKKEQIYPIISRCCNNLCVLSLCCSAEENSTFPEKVYDPSKEGNAALIGKLVKYLMMGGVTFHNPDGYEEVLDLNWKQLQNMAQPVVDEQLAKLAMTGK
jgi:hypothetical protein